MPVTEGKQRAERGRSHQSNRRTARRNRVVCSSRPARAGYRTRPTSAMRTTSRRASASPGGRPTPRISSIRSGFGIYYDQTLLNAHLNARLNPPFRITQLIVNPGTATINTHLQRVAVADAAGRLVHEAELPGSLRSTSGTSATQFTPLSQSLIDVAYVGTRGKDLSRFRRINQPAPGQPPPFPQFQPTLQEIDNSAESKYDALQLKVEKRGARDLNFVIVLHVVAVPRQRDVLRVEHLGRHGGAGSAQPRGRVGRLPVQHRPPIRHERRLPSAVRRGPRAPDDRGAQRDLRQLGRQRHPHAAERPSVHRDARRAAERHRADGRLRPARPGRRSVHRPVQWRRTPRASRRPRSTRCRTGSTRAPSWPRPGASAPRRAATFEGPRFDNLDLSLLREFSLGGDAQRLRLEVQIFNLFNTPLYNLPVGQLRLAQPSRKSSRRTPDRRGRCRSASSTSF